MEILTEFDELQAAMAKINMNESVFPYVNGRLVDSDSFNKTQKLLNCAEMISAHKYLYDLDLDQLTPEEKSKIDKLYDLGVERGFIVDDLTKWDDENGEENEPEDTGKQPEVVDAVSDKTSCWTVIYSAMRDGQVKTGEAYSTADSL